MPCFRVLCSLLIQPYCNTPLDKFPSLHVYRAFWLWEFILKFFVETMERIDRWMSLSINTAQLEIVSSPYNNAKVLSPAYCHMSVCLWRQLKFYQSNVRGFVAHLIFPEFHIEVCLCWFSIDFFIDLYRRLWSVRSWLCREQCNLHKIKICTVYLFYW